MTPADAELTMAIVGTGLSIGGVVWIAGRRLVTKTHLYREDGAPIYRRADACEKKCSGFAEACKGMGETLGEIKKDLAEMKTAQAVMHTEVQYLRRDLNGRVGGAENRHE